MVFGGPKQSDWYSSYVQSEVASILPESSSVEGNASVAEQDTLFACFAVSVATFTEELLHAKHTFCGRGLFGDSKGDAVFSLHAVPFC